MIGAKNILQWVGEYNVTIDNIYNIQKNRFETCLNNKLVKTNSINEYFSQLKSVLNNFLESLDDNEEVNDTNRHALFVEIILKMDEINDITQLYESIYKCKDGIIMHPILNVSISDTSVDSISGCVLDSGELSDDIKISWSENNSEDELVLIWPNLPKNIYMEVHFPNLFFFEKGDCFQIRRGRLYFVWKSSEHYLKRNIKCEQNCLAFPSEQLKIEYDKYINNRQNIFCELINAILENI